MAKASSADSPNAANRCLAGHRAIQQRMIASMLNLAEDEGLTYTAFQTASLMQLCETGGNRDIHSMGHLSNAMGKP